MAFSWRMLAVCVVIAFPTLASAHDRPWRGEAGGWRQYGYSTYPRWDYPPPNFAYGYAPYWTPGPRIYVYPNGVRVWYGPSIAPGSDYTYRGPPAPTYADHGYHHHPARHPSGW
jgi:hypothetical protein